MRKLLLVFAVCLAMIVTPTFALAEEVSPLDGFRSGLSDFFSPDTEESTVVLPRVRETSVGQEELDVDINSISDVVNAWTAVPSATGTITIVPNSRNHFLIWFLGTQNAFQLTALAIGICFMWWGVRKAIHIIMSAFRNGKMSLGVEKDYNSPYYGTRRSDWR